MADDRERNPGQGVQGGQGGSQAPGRNPEGDRAAGNPSQRPGGGSQQGGQDRRPGQGMEDEDDEGTPRR